MLTQLIQDNLSASVRQEAERKLIALQDDFKTKETQQRERKNAQRSHKIRFFGECKDGIHYEEGYFELIAGVSRPERQKLVRRIKKLKKSSKGDGVEKELLEARILLNYVLHYPMTQKYVGLFPNQGPSSMSQEEAETERETSNSKEQSLKIKERIRQSMEKGELSNEPEVELEAKSREDQEPIQRKRLLWGEEGKEIQPRQQKARKESKRSNLEGDDFFAVADDE